MIIEEITVWEKKDKKTGEWKRSHSETGHIVSLVPCGTPWQTKVWQDEDWRYTHARINNFKVAWKGGKE